MWAFTVENMTCGHCVRAITQAIVEVDPNAKVEANVAQKEVRVETTLDENQVIVLLNDEGYSAQIKI